ncbi:O-antigen ligase family protein [Chitinibacter bivalviorum]|uniref:O-antigen ligase family protein n=1 Tax=Chitinibacter bivalviorum TaxID=2739434 RepID=A0A7H9BM27_9NEIS|nr:O-antigen ligase family protein [Chitinibacter bivalviorum]QLG89456.1 O-antigen ligase family protein [Chitinibacter bivalviorum]
MLQNKNINVMLLLAAILGFALPVSTALTNVMVPLCGLIGLYLGRHDLLALIRRYPLLVLPLMIWLALGLGAVFSPAPDAWSYFAKYKKLLFAPLLALFFIKGSNKSIQYAIAGFLLGNLGILALSTLVWWTGRQEWFGVTLRGASFISKNAIAQSLLMAFAGALWLGVGLYRRKWLIPCFVLAAWHIANVFLMSPQRTGYMSVLLMLACWGWFYLQKQWRIAFVGLLLLGLGAVFSTSNPAEFSIKQGATEVKSCVDAIKKASNASQVCFTSGGARTYLYVTAAGRIEASPFGYGTGNIKIQLGDMEFGNPHNEYLLQGLQTGVIGMALYMTMLVLAFLLALKLPQIWRALAVGAVVSYMVCSLFNSLLMDITEGNTLIVILALIVAAHALITLGAKKSETHD